MVVTKMSKNEVYKIKPTLEVGEPNTIQLVGNRICIINYEKDKMLCSNIYENDSLAMISYIVENLLIKKEELINYLRDKIAKYYKKLDELVEEAEKTVIYDYPSLAKADMDYIKSRIETINNDIKESIETYNKVLYEKNELQKVRNIIMCLLNKRDVEITQIIFLL